MKQRRHDLSTIAAGCWLAIVLTIAGLAVFSRSDAMVVSQPNNDVTVTATTTASGFTMAMPPGGHSIQQITYTGDSTIVFPKASWPGQMVAIIVCQDGVGGHALGFNRVGGVSLHFVQPTFTATANRCDQLGFISTDINNWWNTGYNLNVTS